VHGGLNSKIRFRKSKIFSNKKKKIVQKMQVSIAYVARPYMVGFDPEKGLDAAKSLASIFEHGVCVCVCERERVRVYVCLYT
jgi:hypothetical protein